MWKALAIEVTPTLLPTVVSLQEYKWINAFIFNQREHLPKREKENSFTYNLAAFHYSQKAFNKAAALLQKVEFTEV